MSKEISQAEKIKILKTLAGRAIERLKELPQPVVRVSGPLTSGGFGYEENLRRFILAQEKLRTKGYTIFDYFEGNHDERQIKELGISNWKEIMEHYYNPIMATGLIKTMFMMPRWRESNGATWEHEYATKLGLQIRTISESWF